MEDSPINSGENDFNLPALSSFPYNNNSTETFNKEEDNNWVTFEFSVNDVNNKLKRGEKLTSPVFITPHTNFPWRLGVHFAGFGQGNPTCISCFLEMGDVTPDATNKMFNSPSTSVLLPPTRRAKFAIDIRDVYGSTLSEKWPRKPAREHFCGVEANNTFDLRTARDYGYQLFCPKQLFKDACVAGDDTATFVVRVLSTPEMQKVQLREEEENDDEPVRRTEFVGLENQGATCYLNSLIQTLYHLPELRRQVYAIDTALDSSEEGVVLAIQHLFVDLQLAERNAASTERLTKAFGWTDSMVFIQHDVQEMLRELLDKLEKRILLGDKSNTVIATLFSSKYETFVRCQGGFTSSRVEEFFDVSLDVLGYPSVLASFDMYCKEEELNGDNQYEAPPEHGGKQDAIKGVRFCAFPPVLHLHLKRFAYNYELDKAYKIHDRFEFTDELNLNPYVVASEENSQVDYTYKLHSVLVHSGNDQRGHYYVYIYINNKWYKFNDETVTNVRPAEAMEEAFGGGGDGGHYSSPKRWKSDSSASAYMLVYIRKSMWDELMRPMDKVPVDLLQRFAAQAESRRAAKIELERRKHGGRVKFATLRNVCSLVELSPERKQDGNTLSVTDFCDYSQLEEVEIGDLRYITNSDLYQVARRTFSRKHVRLWFVSNPDCTLRARHVVLDNPTTLVKSWLKTNKMFVELSENDNEELPARAAGEITLFFRKYDPATASLVPGEGAFIANTGLFHGPGLTRRKVWDMFRERVLLLTEEEGSEQYEMYDLFDLNPAYSGECDNVTEFPCDGSRIVTDGMSECGDILIYTRKPSANGEKEVLTYFAELVYTCKVTVNVLNSIEEKVQIKTMLNDQLDHGVCTLVAEKLNVSSEQIAVINAHASVPYDESEHAFFMLLEVLPQLYRHPRSNVEHYAYLPTCEVTIEVLPIARRELDNVQPLHFVVHVPEVRSTNPPSVRDSLMLRNDKPIPVSVFLPQLDFDLLVAETRAKLAPWLTSATKRLVLFTVLDGTPTLVDNTTQFARIGALNSSWKVLEQDGTVVLPDAYSYDARWFGEVVDCAEGKEVALMPLQYCFNVRIQLEGDLFDCAGLPTFCPLLEGDNVGTFWRRLMGKLFITIKPNWRLCVLVDKRIVYLDRTYDTSQSVSPSPPNPLVDSSTPDSQTPSMTTMRRQNSQLPESQFDQLPLWFHAAFDQFRDTRLVENLPTLLLVYPTYKSGGSNGSGSQTSLSIRSS